VIPLVAVSGRECVDALVQAGFVVRSRDDDQATLGRGSASVVVPDVAMLTPEELSGILRAAAVPYDDFLDLLSEAPTDPAIARPTFARRRPASF